MKKQEITKFSKKSGKIKNRRINWSQSILVTLKKSRSLEQKKKAIKKFKYVLLLKKYHKTINYKQLLVLKAFITKVGKIRQRRKTHVTIQQQHKISKCIKQARSAGLVSFNYVVKI